MARTKGTTSRRQSDMQLVCRTQTTLTTTLFQDSDGEPENINRNRPYGPKRFPIDGGICICQDDIKRRGEGKCYLCQALNDPQDAVEEATDTCTEKQKDGSYKEVKVIDVDRLPELFKPIRKVSLKLRRKRKDHKDSEDEDVLQNYCRYSEE